MNASELALRMLEWEKRRKELDDLEKEIAQAVAEIGKTQTVGNVRATYTKGRTTYDYETAAVEHPMYTEGIKDLHTTPKTDWKKVCEYMGVDRIPVLKQGDPSVSIKLVE